MIVAKVCMKVLGEGYRGLPCCYNVDRREQRVLNSKRGPSCTDKKIWFSSNIRKFRIWLTASSYMGKYLRISSYIRKLFLIYDFATAPLWISLYMRKFWFSFLSVCFPPPALPALCPLCLQEMHIEPIACQMPPSWWSFRPNFLKSTHLLQQHMH